MITERGKGFRAGCPLAAFFLGCSALQQLVGFDTKCLGQLPYDLQACVEGALLELAQIAPAHLRFISEIVLREPLLMAESAQVGGEHVSQIHARSRATCLKCSGCRPGFACLLLLQASRQSRVSIWPSSMPIRASSAALPLKPTCSDTSASAHHPSTKWCSSSNEPG